MEELSITKQQACRFLLAYQSLWADYQLEGKAGIMDYFRRVGCVQFDPLDIVGNNHELVLQSRIKDYRSTLLQELLYKDRRLIDQWDKNMSVYSIEDWPYFGRVRESAGRRLGSRLNPVIEVLPQVRRMFEEKGPLSSADLDFNQTVDWSWAPTRLSRAALESMYLWGEIIIHHKIRTRRVYDLASRYIDKALLQAPDPNETEKQYFEWYVLRRIGSIGLLWNKTGDAWLGIRGLKSKERSEAFEALLQQGKIIKVSVEGIRPFLYMRSTDKPFFDMIAQWEERAKRAAILAPLDNMLWDRRMIKDLFAFDYCWEVYKPADERAFGYYVLPVLYDDRFVARFEPIRDKKSGALIIRNWWWEQDIYESEELYEALRRCFKDFCGYLGMDRIEIEEEIKKTKNLEWLII